MATFSKVEIYLETSGVIVAALDGGSSFSVLDDEGIVEKSIDTADRELGLQGTLVSFASQHPPKIQTIPEMDDPAWKVFVDEKSKGRSWQRWHGRTSQGRWNVVVYHARPYMAVSREDICRELDMALDSLTSAGVESEFRKGRQEYHAWGTGVWIGSKQYIVKKLASHLFELKISDIDTMKAAGNLTGFCLRLQALLPDETLAGYFLGKLEADRFGVFGCVINDDEIEDGKPVLIVKDLPRHIQRFLYVCAFWVGAADGKLRSAEQMWLSDQFGGESSQAYLDEFRQLEGSAFFQAFDEALRSLSRQEEEFVLPVLGEWLMSCASADGNVCKEEEEVIEEIRERCSTGE